METVSFALCAALLLSMSACVVVARNPLRAALGLIVALTCLSVLFVMLDAPFVAAMQVLVYAGAIMVLFLFVIMLLNLRPDALQRPAYLAVSKAAGAGAMLYVLWLGLRATLHQPIVLASGIVDGSVKRIGQLLLTDFLFNFEAISILLLVAVVGAIVLGKKELT